MNSFYDIENIVLDDKYISDTMLIALAWKRSQDYIRSLNWYADIFELDRTSLFFVEKSKEWSQEIKKMDYTLEPLKLVPAPKSFEWGFENRENGTNWGPKYKTDEELKNFTLRPLAHIGIKEQTFFTTLMMCLANEVETIQGNPSLPFNKVHLDSEFEKKDTIHKKIKPQIVNYGNRLYCTYDENGVAQHNYGATTIYSKYFKDYRNFLQRPYYFAQKYITEKLPSEEIYIVEIDLKRFFDKVNRNILVDKILSFKSCENIKNIEYLLKQFVEWEWSDCALEQFNVCRASSDDMLPLGIPQGLVAGGFLANIYLLEFDEKIKQYFDNYINVPIESDTPSFKLIDYCRYVDDLRFVIIGPNSDNNIAIKNLLKNEMHSFVNNFLVDLKLEIEINETKTNVSAYKGKKIGISKQLNEIQNKTSGPMSPKQTDDLVNELEILLSIEKQDSIENQNSNQFNLDTLANIEHNIFDVREDTIRRFATNQLTRHLSEIRHFTSREIDEYGKPIPGDWDYLQERIARRLISVWSKDPSLALLLKKALELFPSPKLLEPVLKHFKVILNKNATSELDEKMKAVVRYLLAEVFRHAATIIHCKDVHTIPAHADRNNFFEILQKQAVDIVRNHNSDISQGNNDWCFLVDQARFLLLVRLDTLLEINSGNIEQDLIFKIAKGFRNITIDNSLNEEDIAVCILIADQLLEDNQTLIRSVNELFNENKVNPHKILTSISVQNNELAESLIIYARKLNYNWINNNYIKDIIKKIYLDIKPSKSELEKIKSKQSIIQLITRPDNPFSNEIMAIKLMLGLIDRKPSSEIDLFNMQIDLSKTYIIFENGYSQPPKYNHIDHKIIVEEIVFQNMLSDDLLDIVDITYDQRFLQKIAFTIRAALAGSKDITGFGKHYNRKSYYRGLRSTQSKRIIGLYTTPESLIGANAQVTGWLTTLISKLLRWPGIRVNEQGYKWPEELNIKKTKKLLEDRLALLKANYCQLSQIPSLPELITPAWEDKKDLTVVMVQSKLPSDIDLSSDMYLEKPNYRTKHRRHIAEVSALILQHIQAQKIDKNHTKIRDSNTDLIIWPELAVHQDDLDILIQLSRKTHAIIFSGLGFIRTDNNKAINTAVWIVPKKHNGNQTELIRFQGKHHMTKGEKKLGIQSWRPYQLILELQHPKYPNKPGFMLTGAICYDSTDIKLSADLTNKSNAFIVSALNRDIATFDSMVQALHYHMYQHVVLVNVGTFGGSYAMAPYKEHHEKLIAHSKGKDQVSLNTFSMNMFDFRRDGIGSSLRSNIERKTPPAGIIIQERKL
ncbi:reverse transcriptase domain-containing protein [Acinetobacter baumannii]